MTTTIGPVRPAEEAIGLGACRRWAAESTRETELPEPAEQAWPHAWRATWGPVRACSAARADKDRAAPLRGRGAGRRSVQAGPRDCHGRRAYEPWSSLSTWRRYPPCMSPRRFLRSLISDRTQHVGSLGLP